MAVPVLIKSIIENFSFITIKNDPELKLEHDLRLASVKTQMQQEITEAVLAKIKLLGLDEVNTIENALKIAYTKKESELHTLIAKILKDRLLLTNEEQEKLLFDRAMEKTKTLCFQHMKFLSAIFIIRDLVRSYQNPHEYLDLVNKNLIESLSASQIEFLDLEGLIYLPRGLVTGTTYTDLADSLIKRCNLRDAKAITQLKDQFSSYPDIEKLSRMWINLNLGQISLTSIGRIIAQRSIE